MGLMLEFLVEFVLQFVLEALGEIGLQVLSTRVGRLVTGAAVGLLGGLLWGTYVQSTGREALPTAVFISLVLAIGGVIAAVQMRDGAAEQPSAILPWRWSARQWESFALLNVFVALGIVLGFA